jgi:hypothetical protein
MPDHIYSDKEIAELVDKLNACYPVDFQWAYKRAIKEHTDLFDQKISAGEHYYRMRMGGSYGNDLKLSCLSMERLLFAVFAPGPIWEEDADKAIDERMRKARRIIDNLRPR